jgi:hypothetical protein
MQEALEKRDYWIDKINCSGMKSLPSLYSGERKISQVIPIQ